MARAEAIDARYHKIQGQPDEIEQLLIQRGVKAIPRKSAEIVLDFDATDDPLHGSQQGAYFHGYYRHYCYLPLYCFCGNLPLFAKLRDCKRDASDGTVEALQKIVPVIRQRFGKRVRIIVRADSGFAREAIMAWCEDNGVDYVFGLARNSRLLAEIEDALAQAKAGHAATGQPARQFDDFTYTTLDSWSRTRRVIGKAEHTLDGANPRFVVTSLKRTRVAHDARSLYEDLYCARGEAENRIGEQFELFADRASSATMQANQLRMSFSAMAYVLVDTLRRVGLPHVRGHEADGRNFGHFSMTCDRRIRGVCLSRGGCLGRVLDREDLLRH